MVSNRELSELLLSIRSTAADINHWEGFLDQLSKLTKATAAVIIYRRREERVNELLSLGGTLSSSERRTLFPSSQKLYAERYGTQDPYHSALMRSGLSGVIPGERLIPRRLLEHSDMYHALLAPNKLEHMCLAPVTRSKSYQHQLAVWREQSPGPFSQDECEWLGLLIPHLRTAISVHRSLGLNSRRLAFSTAMTDALDHPMFLLDNGLRLVHYNRTAENALRCGTLFYIKSKELHVREPSSDRRFCDLVARILARTPGDSAHAGGAIPLCSTTGNGAKSYVFVRPVLLDLTGGSPTLHILVLLKAPYDRALLAPDMMRQLWSCTPAECGVATLLLADRTPEEIAATRGVSIGTVRNQIKALLAKTGTRRQSQLVRLLLAMH